MSTDLASHLNGQAELEAQPRPSRLRRVAGSTVPPLITGLVILFGLEVFSRAEVLPPILFPSPFSVFAEMGHQATTDFLWLNLWTTFQEAALGFVIGSLIGFVGGVAIGLSRMVSKAIYPFVIVVQAIPRVALAPVIIAFFGFGMSSKVVIAVAICFFPVLINTIVGLRQADQSALLLMRSLQATRWQAFKKLLLPSALPSIFAGLKTAMTFAFIGAIVGELIAANQGIGRLIEHAAFQLRFDAMFGYILWLALLSLIAFGVMEWLDRKLIFWTEDIRSEGREPK